MPTEYLEWLAFSIGTIGTILWSVGFKYKNKSIEGWFWLISSLLWIYFAYLNNHKGLAARDLLGLILYFIGIVNSFKSKNH